MRHLRSCQIDRVIPWFALSALSAFAIRPKVPEVSPPSGIELLGLYPKIAIKSRQPSIYNQYIMRRGHPWPRIFHFGFSLFPVIGIFAISLSLPPFSSAQALKITSHPPGAAVELDGVPVGTTPLEKKFAGGYELERPSWTEPRAVLVI
jgi:PEGA domain